MVQIEWLATYKKIRFWCGVRVVAVLPSLTRHSLSSTLFHSCSPFRPLSNTSSEESDGESKEAVITAVTILDTNLAAERYLPSFVRGEEGEGGGGDGGEGRRRGEGEGRSQTESVLMW